MAGEWLRGVVMNALFLPRDGWGTGAWDFFKVCDGFKILGQHTEGFTGRGNELFAATTPKPRIMGERLKETLGNTLPGARRVSCAMSISESTRSKFSAVI